MRGQSLKSPSQPYFFFVYMQEFGYYILLRCANEGTHCETTKDN